MTRGVVKFRTWFRFNHHRELLSSSAHHWVVKSPKSATMFGSRLRWYSSPSTRLVSSSIHGELRMALLLLHPPSLPPRAEGNGNSEESAHARPYSSDASGEIRSGPIAATTSTWDQICDEILHTITFKTSSSSCLSRELSLEKKIRSRDAETFWRKFTLLLWHPENVG